MRSKYPNKIEFTIKEIPNNAMCHNPKYTHWRLDDIYRFAAHRLVGLLFVVPFTIGDTFSFHFSYSIDEEVYANPNHVSTHRAIGCYCDMYLYLSHPSKGDVSFGIDHEGKVHTE
jgi:hypothetical protein